MSMQKSIFARLLPRFTLALAVVFTLGTRGHAQEVLTATEQSKTFAFVVNLLSPVPVTYDVRNVAITYSTTDVFGQATIASGLVCLPDNQDISWPMGVYNHGTVDNREAVPSREGVFERQIPQILSGQGYIMCSPDYLGLGDSPGIHPYVHADSEASAGRDMLIAVRKWLGSQGYEQNGQLFLTGYSQGGHATQALHRDLQTNPGDDDLTVTAASHLSGPYSIADVMRTTPFADSLLTLPGYITYTYISYNYVYELYDDLGQVFVPPYRTLSDSFANESIQLFDYNAELTARLLQNDDRLLDILQDSIQEQLRTRDPDAAIIQALEDNDTYDWAPEAPTLIYYCTADQQVPFRNAILADSVMRANGSTSITLESGGPLSHEDCVEPAAIRTVEFFEQFAQRNPVSTGEVVQLDHVSVQPNPVVAGGVLTLEGLPAPALNYRVYDAGGREVDQGQLAGNQLTVPTELNRGWYTLRLGLPGGKSFVRRIVVR